MQVMPKKKRKKIFTDDRKMRSFFRPEHGYTVYVRCRYCGAWTDRDFCNSTCSLKFHNIALQFPEYGKRLLRDAHEDKLKHLQLIEQHDQLILKYERLLQDKLIPLWKIEKQVILMTIKQNNFNYFRSAHSLGITRRTLYNKLNEYGFKSRKDLKTYLQNL